MQKQEQSVSYLKQTKSEPKSSLNPKGSQGTTDIQYIKQQGLDDNLMELSDEEKQEQINKMRQDYIREKLNRKKQLIRMKKQQFGSSSSEDDDVGVEESESGYSEEIARNVEEKIRENSNIQTQEFEEINILSTPKTIFELQGKENWNQRQILLKEQSIFINVNGYQIQKIHKIKAIPQLVSKNLLKLKLSYSSDDLILAASRQLLTMKKQKLSLHYIIFASIITRKLEMMGLKFCPPQKNVPGIPDSIIKNSKIYGKIFKKSQILGRWEQRLVVINEMGMYSYKRFNEQHSMFISASSVKQIWTRFEIVDQNLLVVKIIHSSNTKTQFGIPLNDFLNQKNWLFQFYQMGMAQVK